MTVSKVINILFAPYIIYISLENLKQDCHAILQANQSVIIIQCYQTANK